LFLALLSGCGITGYGSQGASIPLPVFHYVQSGETMATIGSRYGVLPDVIANLNGIRDLDSITTGQRLFVGWGVSSNGGAVRLAGTESKQVGKMAVVYSDGQLFWPVGGGNIVSRFGTRSGRFHDGLDIAAPSGTPVFAAHSGVVIYSDDELSGYGNLVIIRGDDGLSTVYGHNRRMLVSVGRRVKRGEKIAEVGATGRASGPHLHFEVRKRKHAKQYAAVDPLPFFKRSVVKNPNYRINNNLTPILERRR